MRLVLRNFVTARRAGTEIALWSRVRGTSAWRPDIRRCVRRSHSGADTNRPVRQPAADD
jgi:hypothetical protein